jgi:hypothetical protein
VLAAFRRVLVSRARADDTDVLAEPLVWSAPASGVAARDRDEVLAQLGAGSIAVERILDLGTTRAAFQVVGARGPAALLVTIDAGTVTAVERFGAELLPASTMARSRGVTATAIAEGEPNVRNVATTRKIYAAANAREWAVLSDLVADDAPHVQGADAATGFEAGLRTLLTHAGARVNVRRHFAVRDYVVVQLQLTVPNAGDGIDSTQGPDEAGGLHRPVAAGLDVLRLDHGRVVASWRYVNRTPGPSPARTPD